MASPEASAAYLARSNFKTLMEWLTARCILHRPDDPMVFCRDLLSNSIEARGGKMSEYDPNCVPRLLKECYDDAMNAADEHGIIHPEKCKEPIDDRPPRSGDGTSTGIVEPKLSAGIHATATAYPEDTKLPELHELLRAATASGGGEEGVVQRADRPNTTSTTLLQAQLLSVFRELCELARPEIAAAGVVASACKAVSARRASLFKVVNEAGGLREMGANGGANRIAVESGKGLVGRAAAGNVGAVLVPNPVMDEAFVPEVDLPGGAGARNYGERVPGLMCGPVKDSSGAVWGVLTVTDPVDADAFNIGHLENFIAVSDVAGVSMRNSEAFGLKETEGEKFRNMVEVIEATNCDLGMNHLLYTIAKCLPVICDAQKCTCFLVEDDKDELWAVQGEVNIRVPKSKGIVGAVATTGKAENISNVYDDPRFNKEVDVATGFQTHSILAMPVRGGEDNRIIAVVQLINKQGGDSCGLLPLTCEASEGQRFTEQDAAVIGTFLGLLGPHIFASSMFRFQRKMNIKVGRRVDAGPDEEEAFPPSTVPHERLKSAASLRTLIDAGRSLQEEEEEGEDEDGNDGDGRDTPSGSLGSASNMG